MKNKSILFLSALVLFLSGCGCKDEPPAVTLVNHGSAKASIQIKTSNGNTENINNVDPGWSSGERRFAAGSIEFTVTIQGVLDPVVYSLSVEDCMDYVVSINPDNSVSASHEERD